MPNTTVKSNAESRKLVVTFRQMRGEARRTEGVRDKRRFSAPSSYILRSFTDYKLLMKNGPKSTRQEEYHIILSTITKIYTFKNNVNFSPSLLLPRLICFEGQCKYKSSEYFDELTLMTSHNIEANITLL